LETVGTGIDPDLLGVDADMSGIGSVDTPMDEIADGMANDAAKISRKAARSRPVCVRRPSWVVAGIKDQKLGGDD